MSKFVFNYAHFRKPGILLWSSECLKLITRNYYKNIWRVEFVEKVMHIIQLSHVLQGEIVQVFFFIQTHTLIAWLQSFSSWMEWLPILFLHGYNAFSSELFVSALKLKNRNCGISPLLIWVKFYHKIINVSQFTW